jgi:flagellar protein FlaI
MIGTSKALEDIRKARGWSTNQLKKELEVRKRIIEFMVKQNIKDSKSVSNIIHTFQVNPRKILERIDSVVVE